MVSLTFPCTLSLTWQYRDRHRVLTPSAQQEVHSEQVPKHLKAQVFAGSLNFCNYYTVHETKKGKPTEKITPVKLRF